LEPVDAEFFVTWRLFGTLPKAAHAHYRIRYRRVQRLVLLTGKWIALLLVRCG